MTNTSTIEASSVSTNILPNSIPSEFMEEFGKNMNEYIRSSVESSINRLLKGELTSFLEYEPYDRSGKSSGNSRNGYTYRTIDSEFGPLKLGFPRDRLGQFHTAMIDPYSRRTDGLETTVIQLYSKGVTTSEIAELIEKMYGSHYSPATISNITKSVEEDVVSFHNAPLKEQYTAIYADAIYIPLRRKTVCREPLHVLIGVDDEGYKQVLDYAVYPVETCANYQEMFENLKARGVNKVLTVISDGLPGMKRVVEESFHGCRHQTCWTHLQRGVQGNVRASDKAEISEDLKAVYTADSVESAKKELDEFSTKWKSQYPRAVKKVTENESLFSFYAFPESLRKSLYTTNTIESFNKGIRAQIKKKQQFPTEDAEDRAIYMIAANYNQKSSRCLHGFQKCQFEIKQMFEDL